MNSTPLPTAIVTGATGGMGSVIVRDLASTHRVLALGRSPRGLDALAALPGVTAVSADLGAPDLLGAVLGELFAGLPRIDALVHAAAIGAHRQVAEASVDEWEQHLRVNVIAPAELTRLALPGLRAAEGTVVFLGSGAGTRPVPGSAVYAASKHALRGLADTLRIDEEPHRVRVTTVAPGQTDTQMLRSGITPEAYTPERYIRPESIAAAVRFVLEAGADTQLTDLAVRPRQEIARR